MIEPFELPKLHWWECVGARLFGQRIEEMRDGDTVFVAYRWLGRVYVLGDREGTALCSQTNVPNADALI